jgi:ribonucleoside-diphosphate reductase alpha chain
LSGDIKLLRDLVHYRTYAKYIPSLNRRETFLETVDRKMSMDLNRFPFLEKDIIKAYDYVKEFKVMPSMRGLQFSGEAIDKNNIRSYNCAYTPIDNIRTFDEILFLLLSGTGVGISVQKHHVGKLPVVKLPAESMNFKAHDSIEGWAQCLQLLMEAYFLKRIKPIYDFSAIRDKGSYLSTTGARAPGPVPLMDMLARVELKLKASIGRKLRPIEVHDIACIIADCVLAGGIRRAALSSLFSSDDKEMLSCKQGDWSETSPWRARANNSAVLLRGSVEFEEFEHIFNLCKESGYGEPGFVWTSDKNLDWGQNPCFEIALEPNSFCNLTEINQNNITSKEELLDRIWAATLLGTLQASYTDFPYIRDIWRKTTENSALLGVSFTGIADNYPVSRKEWLNDGARFALLVNEEYAKQIGINPAHRVTTVKPAGSTSCMFGTSSGIHPRFSNYYIRRIRMNDNDSLALFLKEKIPELVERDSNSNNGLVISIPQSSPIKAITRDKEMAIGLLGRAFNYFENWIQLGHRKGINYNNVSLTNYIRKDEWEDVLKVMWHNRAKYNGISLFPFDNGKYKQAPFEEIKQKEYEEARRYIDNAEINLSEINETYKFNDFNKIVACNNGVCEIV